MYVHKHMHTHTKVILKAPGANSSQDIISPVVMEVSQETGQRLHVKFYDPNNKRWEVPTRYSEMKFLSVLAF